LDEDHSAILKQFPSDHFLKASIRFCRGLRVLRQDSWECLAGFILSSTKKIIHIQQIWQKVSERWGNPLKSQVNGSTFTIYSFPRPEIIARLKEIDLRQCGMGFRAPYLLGAAKAVASGNLNLDHLKSLPTEEARNHLVQLKGVGPKIADCMLLFSLGKNEVFPVDTWILKVIRNIYLPRHRKLNSKKILHFARTHFGPYGGHAQQYLFHYARMNPKLLF